MAFKLLWNQLAFPLKRLEWHLTSQTPHSTAYIATGEFIEYYYGHDSLSVLNRSQTEEYENHVENLTKKYTDQPVIANCTVIGQRNVTDGRSSGTKRGRSLSNNNKRGSLLIAFTMHFSDGLKIGYGKNKIKIDRRRMQILDKDIGKQLVSNFTSYINENQTI